MSDRQVVTRVPTSDGTRPDYHHLPATPPRELWHATQDVVQDDPGPTPFAYNHDAEMLLRFGWG